MLVHQTLITFASNAVPVLLPPISEAFGINPGMLGVEAATEVWNTADGTEGKSCASCHEAPESMKGVRAVMPKYNEAKGTMYTLEMYVNDCRTERMGAEAWDRDSSDMVNMTALISSVSRGSWRRTPAFPWPVSVTPATATSTPT